MAAPDWKRTARPLLRRARAFVRRRRTARATLARMSEQLAALTADVASIRSEQHRHFLALRGIYDDEPGNRRRLWALRESSDYAAPFDEVDPLVSIYVTTYSNAEGLAERSIPSILGQTHENLEGGIL